MKDRTIIIISTLVDSTIKSYQPDTEFFIYKTIDELSEEVQHMPIRAQTLFFTRDVIGQTNQSFVYLYHLLRDNEFLNVDDVVYITEEGSQELQSVEYLIQEHNIENWTIIKGNITKAYITEIVNGTAQTDNMSVKKMAVYRQPRNEYVRAKMQEYSTLDEKYTSDDEDLADIPDVEIPQQPIIEEEQIIEKVNIVGDPNEERTAFALLTAQYLSQVNKTIIIESDPDYHKLTEFYTKAEIDAVDVTITDLFNDTERIMERIRKSESNLVVVTCIDRYLYDYYVIVDFLYYNLMSEFRYIVVEYNFDALPDGQNITVVVPDTVIGCLRVGEQLDQSVLKYTKFVGVDLNYLEETHLPSSDVISKILQDILTDTSIKCPVIFVTSLRINGTIYDLGAVLGVSVVH